MPVFYILACFQEEEWESKRTIPDMLKYLLPVSWNLSQDTSEVKKREREKFVRTTIFNGEPLVTTKTAKLGLLVVMYFGKPKTALKDTILSGEGAQTYATQRAAFIEKCETFARERDLVWLALNEMKDYKTRGERGSTVKVKMAQSTLGTVDLVLSRWPIKNTEMLPGELENYLASKPKAIVAPARKKGTVKVTELERRDKARRFFYANLIKEDQCLSILEGITATGSTCDPQYDGLLIGMNPDLAKGFGKMYDRTLSSWKQKQLDNTRDAMRDNFPGLGITCEVKPWQYDRRIMRWALGEVHPTNPKKVICATEVETILKMEQKNQAEQEKVITSMLRKVYPPDYVIAQVNKTLAKDAWKVRVLNRVSEKPFQVTHEYNSLLGKMVKCKVKEMSGTQSGNSCSVQERQYPSPQPPEEMQCVFNRLGEYFSVVISIIYIYITLHLLKIEK